MDESDNIVGWHIYCPGCQHDHVVPSTWSFNGDYNNPSFTPSLKITSGHYIAGHKGDCWCTYNASRPNEPVDFICYQCHSVITNGQITFCPDCSHSLAGQTITLPELP